MAKSSVSDLMTKLRAFEAANVVRTGPTCSACRLPEPLRAFLVEGSRAGSTQRALAAIVTGQGHKIGRQTVGNHLREHVGK